MLAATRDEPIVGGTETVEKAETVLLYGHLAQLVLQTYSMNIHALMTQEHCLHIQIKTIQLIL